MKFVRTKKNIFELIEVNKEGNCKVKVNNVLGSGVIEPENVVKIADTVTELFDELVCDKKVIKDTQLQTCLEQDKAVYGAIWIEHEHGEPILKSVAKFSSTQNVTLF